MTTLTDEDLAQAMKELNNLFGKKGATIKIKKIGVWAILEFLEELQEYRRFRVEFKKEKEYCETTLKATPKTKRTLSFYLDLIESYMPEKEE